MPWRRILWAVAWAPLQLWGVLSLYYGTGPELLRLSLSVLYGAGHFALLARVPKGWILPGCAAWFALLPLGAFLLATPSHNRDWQADVERLPYAEQAGSIITVHNVRNCDYQSAAQFTVRYEDRSYDLNQLESVDLILSDWGLGDVVHTLLSFGFGPQGFLCLSVEARKEKGESYSALLGFFRRFELIYILGDERDLVRLRTNYRDGETVSLYRLRVASAGHARRQFMSFLEEVNRLHAHPQWYNALTANCMTSVFKVAQKNARRKASPWHKAVILNGHLPEWMHRDGAVDATWPLEEMKTRCIVNERAQSATAADDFSIRIREGLPGMDWVLGEQETVQDK